MFVHMTLALAVPCSHVLLGNEVFFLIAISLQSWSNPSTTLISDKGMVKGRGGKRPGHMQKTSPIINDW